MLTSVISKYTWVRYVHTHTHRVEDVGIQSLRSSRRIRILGSIKSCSVTAKQAVHLDSIQYFATGGSLSAE